MNIMKMMKQAQEMQSKMGAVQAEIAEQTIEVSAGGGKINVVCRGSGAVESLKIDPSVVDADDVEMLEDLILSGIRQAQAEAAKYSEDKMKEVTAGMDLPPGMGL